MPVTQAEITWAVNAFAANQEGYAKARKYYAGSHDLAFATDKFNKTFGSLFRTLAYNRCKTVVDAQANKMQVKGFSVRSFDPKALAITDIEGTDYGAQAMTLWRMGRMPLREGEIYTEAGTTGDAYGVVWFDDPPPIGTGLPRIFPNRAEIMRARFDDNGRINLAAKSWRVETGHPDDVGKRRLTIYTATEIVKLITTAKAEAGLPKEMSEYGLIKEVNALGQPVLNPLVHNLGRPPVVHYANNAGMVGDYGQSELIDVIPLQDALNKAIADMLVAMEYNAFPQRWAIGIAEPEIDPITGLRKLPFRQGAGEIWFSTDKEASFGNFEAASLQGFLDVQNQFDLDIARVSFTPVFWLIQTGTPPSGESNKTASAPFTAKIEDRQRSAGAGHADAVAMQFQLLGVTDPLVIDVDWVSAEPRSDREQVELGKLMVDAGVPLTIAARKMGLSDEDIAELEALEEEKAASQERGFELAAGQQLAGTLNQPPVAEPVAV